MSGAVVPFGMILDYATGGLDPERPRTASFARLRQPRPGRDDQ